MRRLLAVTVVGLFGWFLYAQKADKTPLFRVSSERLIIEFLAVNKDGRFVNDLKADEIEVKIDGKKQKVDRLFPPLGRDGSAMTPGADGAQEGEVDLYPPERRGGTARTAIVLDSRVLDASNFHHSRRAIRKFIAESLESDHFVMLAEIDRKLEVLTPFTRDRQKLLEVVDKLRPSTLYNRLDTTRLRSNPGPEYIDELFQQMVYLRSGLRTLVHSLSSQPGRKHVVFFSEGYPMNPVQDMEFFSRSQTASVLSSDARQAASRRAGTAKDPGVIDATSEIVALSNAYGVSFYTVDARGLTGVPGLSADTSGGSSGVESTNVNNPAPNAQGGVQAGLAGDAGAPSAIEGQALIPFGLFKQTAIDDISDSQNFLIALAGGTNGTAFFNTNNLEAVLHASTAEQRNIYLASIDPDLRGKGPKFRRVEVKCKRKDVVIRSQAGLLDLEQNQLANARRAQALETPEYFKGVDPILEIEREGKKTNAVFGIVGQQIAYTSSKKGKRVELLFLGQVLKPNGDPATKNFPIQRFFALDLTDAEYSDLSSQNLMGRQELKLDRGDYRLILLVEDHMAGTMGAKELEFTVN
ncbi:MAG TPA: VWA domain-containing protein [Acidobacteriota bacterium]|nr:VWA domain-containing protein [Acidobacteriota bacterium]